MFVLQDDSDEEVAIISHNRGHVGRVPHSPSVNERDHSQTPSGINDEDQAADTPTRSSSPQAGSKRRHNTDDEENYSNIEDADVHISKAQKTPKKTTRPKAGDYDEFGKEIVLAAANIYRALLASQGAFPNPSTEITLIKKAWKTVNAESGEKSLTLTPSIVTIVSQFIYYQVIKLIFVRTSRSKLEARNFAVRRK